MVSLGEDSRGSGGYFFDSPDNPLCNENDENPDVLVLGGNEEHNFRCMKTIPIIIVLIAVAVILTFCAALIPEFCHNIEDCTLSSLSILSYVHASIWVLFMVADRYLHVQHNLSRMYGYLEFYRNTRYIRRVPLITLSTGNACFLVISTILTDYCKTDNQCPGVPFNRMIFIQILVAVEILIIIPVLVFYLIKTRKFNNLSIPPDAHQDDGIAAYIHSSTHSTDIGFKDDGFIHKVLEKQADLIGYLRQHNEYLGVNVLRLTTELNKTKRV